MLDKVLFVDDEQFILDGFQSNLRKRYDVTIALGPEVGLESVQSKGPFAVVVSDLKMPGMDGFAFLSKVGEISPETVCIMLTGFADLEAAVKAVDEGHVFQLLTKPCSVDNLSKSLDAGIIQHTLVRTERELLTGTLKGTIRVLTEALSLANPGAYGRAQRVKTMVHDIAHCLDVEVSWELDLASMLLNIGCMSIPRNILDDIISGKEVSEEWMDIYDNNPSAGARLLEKIPRLEAVAAIVEEQCNKLHSQQPVGAQFLKVAGDFDLLMTKGFTPYEAYGRMLTSKESYEPKLLEALGETIPQESGYIRKHVAICGLTSNMTLEEDVVTREGLLLMAKSAEINDNVIRWLRKASLTLNIVEPIAVKLKSVQN